MPKSLTFNFACESHSQKYFAPFLSSVGASSRTAHIYHRILSVCHIIHDPIDVNVFPVSPPPLPLFSLSLSLSLSSPCTFRYLSLARSIGSASFSRDWIESPGLQFRGPALDRSCLTNFHPYPSALFQCWIKRGSLVRGSRGVRVRRKGKKNLLKRRMEKEHGKRKRETKKKGKTRKRKRRASISQCSEKKKVAGGVGIGRSGVQRCGRSRSVSLSWVCRCAHGKVSLGRFLLGSSHSRSFFVLSRLCSPRYPECWSHPSQLDPFVSFVLRRA